MIFCVPEEDQQTWLELEIIAPYMCVVQQQTAIVYRTNFSKLKFLNHLFFSNIFSHLIYIAPPTTPSLITQSSSPISTSITWDEIPCVQRNGVIARYIVFICQVTGSHCVDSFIANAGTNRMYTFTQLIPRTLYNISIRADSQDRTFTTFAGSLSTPLSVVTTAPQG